MAVKHAFTSAVADGADNTLVQPSDWNADHTIDDATITAAKLHGAAIYLKAAAPNQNFDLTNGGGGGAVTIISQSVSGIAVGDFIEMEVWYSILNNSGATKTYAHSAALGSLGILATEGTTVAASATSRSLRRWHVRFSVSATNLSYGQLSQVATAIVATDTHAALAVNLGSQAWDTATDDLTGTQTLAWTVTSSAANTTQTLTLHSYTIRKVSAN